MPIVKPHRIRSREVTPEDLPRVKGDLREMVGLCFARHGRYNGGKAVAHCQITSKDPLKFFVMKNGTIVINPVIERHNKKTMMHREGCLSYPDKPETVVPRWNKLTVRYITLMNDEFVEKLEELSGINAKIFQHEIDHFNGKYIYDY